MIRNAGVILKEKGVVVIPANVQGKTGNHVCTLVKFVILLD